MIRDAVPDDAGAVCTIYNHYIKTSNITFEVEPLMAEEMAERIETTQQAGRPWLIWEEGTVEGFAYASPWKTRAAYLHTLETSIYLAETAHGKGVGTSLYGELIKRLREQRYHTLIAGITIPNPASIALHEKMGFHKVAHFEEVGFKQEQWLDVGYWQLKL